MPMIAKRRRTSEAGDGEQHLIAFGLGPVVRACQGVNPGRITKPGLRHVHHKRAVAARGRVEQRYPQPGGVADVDLLRRGDHRHAADHLNRGLVLSHAPPPVPCRHAVARLQAAAPLARQARITRGHQRYPAKAPLTQARQMLRARRRVLRRGPSRVS